jgi:lipid-A-disaccharide synthase
MLTIMMSCGEPSGDLYAGALAAEIRRLEPDCRIVGFGGDRLRAAGATLVGDYRGLTVTGITEAISVLPRSLAMYRRLVAAARAERPSVFVAIDFPDFNFRVAGALKRQGVPVVYYVSPQLWAWRRGRLTTIKRLVDQMLVIFPFEEDLYRQAGVPVEFVGHPLLDVDRADVPREQFLAQHGLEASAPTIALLPGSRPNEVRAILPVLLEAAELISSQVAGVQFVIARAPNLESGLFAIPRTSVGRAPVVVESRTDDVLAAADVVLTASGTATVQTAIHERPMVIVYRLSPLTYRIGKPFCHVDMYGMVNLVAGRKIVPELIQDAFTPEAVAAEAIRLLTDPDLANSTREALREVKRRLGQPGAGRRAAEAVLRIARSGAAG